jgi:hypothetical protein
MFSQNERYTVELNGLISATGRKRIAEYIEQETGHKVLWSHFNGFEYTNRRGKLAKRLRSTLGKDGVKLTPQQMSEIGNLAFNLKEDTGTFYFEISTNLDVWSNQRGNIENNDGACFQPGGCYHHNWIAMNDHEDFYAVRVYTTEDGPEMFARAWLWNDYTNDRLVVFNSYGITLNRLTIVMSKALNLNVTQGNYTGNGNGDDDIYLNSERVNVLGEEVEYNEHVDLFPLELEGGYYCYACEDRVNEDYVVYSEITQETYCNDCFSDNFTHCYECHGELDNEESYYSENTYNDYCEGCYWEIHTSCEDCECIVLGENTTYCELTYETMCDDCYNKNFTRCQECDEEIYRSEASESGNCEDCQEEIDIGNLAFDLFSQMNRWAVKREQETRQLVLAL